MKGMGMMAGMKSDDDYRAESDHRALSEAAEIQGDKKRMSGVAKHHKKQMRKMSLMQRSMLQSGRR